MRRIARGLWWLPLGLWVGCFGGYQRAEEVEYEEDVPVSEAERMDRAQLDSSRRGALEGTLPQKGIKTSRPDRLIAQAQWGGEHSERPLAACSDGQGGLWLAQYRRVDSQTLRTDGEGRYQPPKGEGLELLRLNDELELRSRFGLGLDGASALALEPGGESVLVAGVHRFYREAVQRNELRLHRYSLNGAKLGEDLSRALRAKFPRSTKASRVEAMTQAADGSIYLGVTLVRARKKAEKGGRLDVGEMLLSKLSAKGEVLWSRPIKTTYNKRGGYFAGSSSLSAIALDPGGDLWATGSTGNTLPGQHSSGSLDIVLMRVDAKTGKPRWARQYGSTSHEHISSIAVSPRGEVYLGGNTGSAWFGGLVGGGDALLLKLDGKGKVLWGRQFGARGRDHIHGLALTAAGDVMVMGETHGVLDRKQPEHFKKWGNQIDGFWASFGSNGAQLEVVELGTEKHDYPLTMIAGEGKVQHLIFATTGNGPREVAGSADAMVVSVREPR